MITYKELMNLREEKYKKDEGIDMMKDDNPGLYKKLKDLIKKDKIKEAKKLLDEYIKEFRMGDFKKDFKNHFKELY